MDKALSFGSNKQLSGILSIPKKINSHLPAFLLWNAGFLHRVGPYRLYVDLARKLTELGFVVFRYDISGKGDSELGHSQLPYEERVLHDSQQAMQEVINNTQAERFVAIGLCSGADDAHAIAYTDNRIIGLVMLDGYAFHTPGYYLHNYYPRLFSLRQWQQKAKKIRQQLFAKRKTNKSQSQKNNQGGYTRTQRPQKNIASELQHIVSRECQILAIYTGGIPNYYNYHNQFRAMFPTINFNNQLQLEFFPDADHTYSDIITRRKLISYILSWSQRYLAQ